MPQSVKYKSAAARENLKKVSISRIKKEMADVSYLSDDLVITSLDAQHNTTAQYPVTIDGFSVVVMMAGEATVSIDMKNHVVRPNSIVFFNPGSISLPRGGKKSYGRLTIEPDGFTIEPIIL